MQRESIEYIQMGIWDRQGELLEEARAIHAARRAVRESGAAPTAGWPTMRAVARRVEGAFRSTVGSLGSALVHAGRRLEGLACRPAA